MKFSFTCKLVFTIKYISLMTLSSCSNICIPKQSKAIVYSMFGNPKNVLKIVTVDTPKPNAEQLLVKMKLASVNPSDLLTIRGTYAGRINFPKVAGFEGVGTVVDTGKRYNNLLGKRVLALRGIGTWQEYNLISANEAIQVPDSIDDTTAAQLYINPLTIWLMLTDKFKIKSNNTLLINAGNSACGHIIGGFSKTLNFDLISIVRRDSCVKHLNSIGITKVIDSSKNDILTEVMNYTHGQGVDFALDAVGGQDGEVFANAVKPYGKIIQYGLMSGEQLSQNYFNVLSTKNVKFDFFHLREWVYNNEQPYRTAVFNEMIKNFIKAKMSLPKTTSYSMNNVTEAVTEAEKERKNCKILLSFND